jgi:hypothetical protein
VEEEPESSFYNSAGIWTEPTVTTSTGIITISIGDYLLYDDNTYDQSSLNKVTITGQTFTVPNDGVSHYVVANYNSGTPITQLITDVTLINQSDIIPILTTYNLDGLILYLFWDQMARGLSNKLCHRLVKTERFTVQPGGLVLGEAATRLLTITSGIVWYGACTSNLVPINSGTTGQEIAFWYHVGGVWTRTTTTQYNNTQYDDGTSLQSLLPNKYAVNWVYRGVSQLNNRPVILLGMGDYTLSEAIASRPPSNPPPVTSSFGILVGRIIVKTGDSTATQIDTLEADLGLSSVTSHNGLSGLQGGTTDQYYHLTLAQYSAIGTIPAAVIKSETTTYTVLTTDDVVLCNGTFTVTLPAATGSGKVHNIKNIGTGLITLEGNLEDVIDGELNQTIYQWENIQVVDGAANTWYIL